MLALLILGAVSFPAVPNPSLVLAAPQVTESQNIDPRHPLFEFAPESGVGMGGPCSCSTNVTGLYGEALTFTRTSSATCMKGTTVTGINDGDLITCAAGAPRVMYGNPNTLDGVLGLLVEGASTNVALRSQEFDNVVWGQNGLGGVSAPTVTANQAIAPDGTLTADRVQIPATTTGQFSIVRQAGCPTSSTDSFSLFVKGNGTSGTLTVELFDPVVCVSCPYNSTSWTRCIGANKAVTTSGTMDIGAQAGDCGGSLAAQDVFLWGAQCEAGAYATSYIATTSATVTRSAESNSLAMAPYMTSNTGSHAVTFIPEWGTSNQPGAAFFVLYDNVSEVLFTESTTNRSATFDGTNQVNANSTAWVAGSPIRLWSSYTGSTQTVNNGSTTSTGSFDGTMGASALSSIQLGQRSGSFAADGVLKQVCADTSPTRCR